MFRITEVLDVLFRTHLIAVVCVKGGAADPVSPSTKRTYGIGKVNQALFFLEKYNLYIGLLTHVYVGLQLM